MAEQPPQNIERIRSYESCAVNQEQEAELMIRYTGTTTRELVFAIDLMDYVLSISDLSLPDNTHPGCCERSGLSDLDDHLKWFIEQLLRDQSEQNAEEMMARHLASYNRIKKLLNYIAINYESWHFRKHRGHATSTYWSFCIRTAQLCALAFKHGLSNAPHFGIMLMCRLFANFEMRREFPNFPWDSIKDFAYMSMVL